MKRRVFYRNIRAREVFEIFLLSAIGSLLVVRFFLKATGYPQLGGNGLHIAHMLWGGLLMAAASIMNLAFIGNRVQRTAALIGGIGFGIFIDEIGKFITSDNNYFFRPSVGIIYAVFVILYLTFNFLSRDRRLTSREYQLNALVQLEEAIVHDMDPAEKERARQILAHADGRSPITHQLMALVENVALIPPERPRTITRLLRWLDDTYTRFWRSRTSRPLVRMFFVIETVLFVAILAFGISSNFDDLRSVLAGQADYDKWLVIGQVVSASVAAVYAIVGALMLTRTRMRAFEQFRRATLINLFLTEFFVFSRTEFRALPGFIFNIGVLLFVTYTMHQERRHIRNNISMLKNN